MAIQSASHQISTGATLLLSQLTIRWISVGRPDEYGLITNRLVVHVITLHSTS